MKKLLSLLIATVMVSSLFAGTVFAENTPTVSATFNKTTANINDLITIKLDTISKKVYNDSVDVKFDSTAFSVNAKSGGSLTYQVWDDFAGEDFMGGYVSKSASYTVSNNTAGIVNYQLPMSDLIEYSAGTVGILRLQALKAGTFTITLHESSDYYDPKNDVTSSADTGYNGLSGTYTVTIVDPNASTTTPVTGVSLDKTAIELQTKGTTKLIATVTPEGATNQKLTWTSSNEGVATVANDGTVTAVGVGEATITVASEENSDITAICKVTVNPVPGYVKGIFTYPLEDLQDGLLTAKLTNNKLTEDNVKTQQLWFVGTPEFDYGDGKLTFTVYTNVKDVNTADITIEVVSTENN